MCSSTSEYLRSDATVHKVLQELFVMMRQNVLNHAQDVERRVGEIFKPMLAPVYWTKKSNLNIFLVMIRATYTKNHPTLRKVTKTFSQIKVPMTVATTSKQSIGLF